VTHLQQILLTTIWGLAFATMVLLIARRGILSMRYTLGWLFVAGCVIVGGLFSSLVKPLASAIDVDPVAVVLAGAMAGLLGITVQLSITVSGLTEVVRTLAESHAILEERVRRLDGAATTLPAPATTPSVEQ